MTDLQHLLEEIGLAQYADLFVRNDIDWEVLPELTEHDLEKLGISLGAPEKTNKGNTGFLHRAAVLSQVR